MTAPINFCHPLFHTKIVCDKVSADGHEVSNLLSSNFEAQRAGFMTETFIKPPVNLTMELPCNLEIDRIIIHGVVGAQKSTGFSMFAYSEKCSVSSVTDFAKEKADTEKYSKLAFKMLCRTWNGDQNVICFRNPRFQIRHQYKDLKSMSSRLISEDYTQHDLRCGGCPQLLTSASHIAITITRTKAGTLPCIKFVEIWGVPSISCPGSLVQELLQIHSKIVTPRTQVPVQNVTPSTSQPNDLNSISTMSSNTQSGLNIPDDFIDPITQQMMALPVLLPSGHTVDQSTVDRYLIEEERWGRSARDPFTGVAFTSVNKPLPNAPLKLRLDTFLLQYGHEISAQGRTVGRSVIEDRFIRNSVACNVDTTQISSLVSSTYPNHTISDNLMTSCETSSISLKRGVDVAVAKESNKLKSDTIDLTLKESKKLKSDTIDLTLKESKKRKCDTIDLTLKEYKKLKVDTIDLTLKESKKLKVDTIALTPDNFVDLTEAESNTKHAGRLAESLDEALGDVLKNLPSFGASRFKTPTSTISMKQDMISVNNAIAQTNSSSDVGQTNETSSLSVSNLTGSSIVLSRHTVVDTCVCTICCRSFNDMRLLYKMPCSHLVCKICLLKVKHGETILCQVCDINVNTRHIVKAHR